MQECQCDVEAIYEVLYGLREVLSLSHLNFEQACILKDHYASEYIETWLSRHPQDIHTLAPLLLDRYSSPLKCGAAKPYLSSISDEEIVNYPVTKDHWASKA